MKTLLLISSAILIGIWVKPLTPHLFVSEASRGSTEAYTPIPTPIASSGNKKVKASWYGVKEYCEKYNPSCIMANGIKLEDDMFIAACADDWKLGDLLSVSYNGKTIIVSCADRGSFEKKYGRKLDLSKAAFSTLAPLSKGVIDVEVN